MQMLVKAAILVSILGIIALYFLTEGSIETVKIENLNHYLGQAVKVEGTVLSKFTSKDGHVFLKITDSSGELSVVAFKNYNINGVNSLSKGDKVEVRGMVKEYKEELEIIAKEIRSD